ncbi:methyl-accepting chemotaxis protein [Stappia sp. ICDLI1TA098]
MARLTVRIRIFLLIAITMAGLAAIGGVFWWSQESVEAAFARADGFTGLASDVAALETASANLRMIEKAYLGAPTAARFEEFQDGIARTRAQIAELAARPAARPYAEEIDKVSSVVGEIGQVYGELHAVQQRLGLADADPDTDAGALATLARADHDLVTRIQKEARFARNPANDKLAFAVVDMARAGKAAILHMDDVTIGAFEVTAGRFERSLARAAFEQATKDDLAATFAVFRKAIDVLVADDKTRGAITERLEAHFDVLPPYLAELRAAAAAGLAAANADLAGNRALASTVMTAIMVAMVAMLLVAGLLIGTSIAGPLAVLRKAMDRLAQGETDIDLPHAAGRTEFDAMTASVAVFRDNALDRERLTAAREQESAGREARMGRLETMISGFEDTASAVLARLDEAADALADASGALGEATGRAAEEVGEAGNAVRIATDNVTSAASASEELNASIAEIAAQARRSTDVAGRAVASARETGSSMTELSRTADRIGEVMSLIREIANQTNLLALNATIEAARAGEHGRGFAVVAAEVKDLAGQTAKATEDIAQQVEAIQFASATAVSAIGDVETVIGEMSDIAGAVSVSVEEQSQALDAIVQNTARASERSGAGAAAMERVSGATEHARGTGTRVGELSGTLADQARVLRAEIAVFLKDVRAA